VRTDRKRRSLMIALGLAAGGAPLAPWAQSQRPGPAFGELNPPQPVEAAGKIEVLEFFWYGCPHCYNLEPAIELWLKKLPQDVAFRRVPAIFSERWGLDAQIFYAFEALGVLDKVHKPFFDAIHKSRLRTDNAAALNEWLEKNGIDPKKFSEAMKSFGVQSKTKRAAQMTVAYKIDGTPAMAVQGRFTVSADQARTREGMLETVDFLVDAIRKRK
jgi:thiol:disulfide interchange protein DsbA